MNAANRLDSAAPELASAFQSASKSDQLRATTLACEMGARNARLEGEIATEALLALGSGAVPQGELSERLRELSATLDDGYLSLVDAEDESTAADAIQLFTKSRAAAALAFAMEGDAASLQEAIYEALATSDDSKVMSTAVLGALRSEQTQA